MSHALLDLLNDVMTSPWVYLALFALAAIDGFFPAVPSETAVITAGVFAATGRPNLALVILVSALGAFAGDHVSYLIGRSSIGRLRRGRRAGAAFAWASKALAERGGMVLVIARYIPGGRTAVTLTMGAVRHPLRSFSFFDGLAAGSWAVYSALIGYFGGMAFENDPVKGLLLGFGVAMAIAVTTEVVRHLRRRRSAPLREDGPREALAEAGAPRQG
ncbi:membrane protein [Sphaerisporangium krabiense]|uniref:Membrane protein DedA with SNARE-associated domain n=1 Tax=Sphaerisporangium krabiense TaxID=763782 RepID=A0A7W8Z9I5_9ACTN|nr:DedA family protein [Sphaerisporangium krabiense]MBB5629956.1 membrane protein DedA with SNARE-associated domain [Sphaerisporangium krabiense]GII61792.1 membrane protein [Sphaerisporangium krabiense]